MADAEELIVPLQESLSLLTTTQGILDGFNHRNKNQFRLSKWWAEFNTLRRNIGKLLLEIQANMAKLERFVKYKKRPPRRGYDEDVNRRIQHIQIRLLPHTFLSFSQLAADNQHAHLGLMLLGVLAQVHKALALLAARDEDSQPPPVLIREDIPRLGGSPERDAMLKISREDVGVAVSRDETMLETATKQQLQAEGAEREPPAMGETRDEPLAKKRKQKKTKGDEFDSLFDPLRSKTPKKKRKQKRGDEFDDLFGALM